MKCKIPCTFEVNITTLTAVLPVYHGNEDIPYGTPCRANGKKSDLLTLEINVDTGRVADWPADYPLSIDMQVRDGGCYSLLGFREDDQIWIRQWNNIYVPRCLGSDDYLEISINDKGFIENWSFDPEDLLGQDEDE